MPNDSPDLKQRISTYIILPASVVVLMGVFYVMMILSLAAMVNLMDYIASIEVPERQLLLVFSVMHVIPILVIAHIVDKRFTPGLKRLLRVAGKYDINEFTGKIKSVETSTLYRSLMLVLILIVIMFTTSILTIFATEAWFAGLKGGSTSERIAMAQLALIFGGLVAIATISSRFGPERKYFLAVGTLCLYSFILFLMAGLLGPIAFDYTDMLPSVSEMSIFQITVLSSLPVASSSLSASAIIMLFTFLRMLFKSN